MRKRKFLSKALSVLLSGAMLVGTIPTTFLSAAAETANGAIEGHTLDGYFSVWSEDFESEDEKLPSGFSTMDWNHDKNTWAKAYNSAGDFTAHHGLGCAYSQSWDSEKGALTPLDTLVLPERYLSGDYDWKLTFMATGTGDNNAEEFTLSFNLDGEAGWESLSPNFTTTGEWQEYTYDLNKFVGHTVKLGIKHYDCTNQYALRVDCINLWAKPVHSAEGHPFNAFFDDFESDTLPSGYLADANTWHATESATAHHGSYCLQSLPDGAEPSISGTNNLIMSNFGLDIGKDYALSFMVKGENAGKVKVAVLSGGKTYDLALQAVDTDEWQPVTVDLSGFSGRTVDIYIMQYSSAADPMYIDCLGLWYMFAHLYGDGRTNVWSEDFEDSELPSGWETLDEDDDGNTWKVNYLNDNLKKHHGVGTVYSESFNGVSALTPDNWLILPTQPLSSGKRTVLTFDAVGQDDSFCYEKFGVFVSTDGGTNYTQLGTDYTATNKWQEIEVDLSAYAGKTVEIAVVHHNCTNQSKLVLDCFNLWELPLKEITTIQANITEPKIGDTPASTATFTTEPAGGLADSSVSWVKVAEADYKGEETTSWIYLEEDEKFEFGYYYLMNMPLELNPGYKFGGTVTSKVNDYTADGSYDGTYQSIWALVPPLEIEITNIAATITEPTFGATPDTNPVVTFDPEDSAYIDYVYWQKIAKADYTGTSDDEWLAMAATEKFEAGYLYAVEISMSTEDGYKVGDECTGTINGKPHDDYWGPFIDDPYAPYLFMRFEPKTPVTGISATITPPVIGETLDFAPVITSSPANSVELENIYWFRLSKEKYTGTKADSWEGVSKTDKVESGYYYTPTLYLSTKDGFVITPDTVGTINNRPHVDTFGELYDSPSQAFLTVGFDPKIPNTVPTAGDGQVTLSWNTIPGAEMYRVYMYDSGTYTRVYSGDSSVTSTVITGLTNGTKYGFVVSAKVSGSWTDYSNPEYIVYATPKNTKPSIVGYKVGDNKVKLEWLAVGDAEMYRVYTYENGVYTRRFTCDGSRNVATVTELEAGKEYGFVVSAKANGTWTSYNNKADLVYATPTGIEKPAIIGYKIGNYKVKLEWKAIEGAEMYRVYTYEDGVYTRKFTCSGERNVATVTGLVSGVKYGFVVSAKVGGVWTDYADTADLLFATPTGDPAPVITGYTTGDSKVKLTWYALKGAEMYRVYTLVDGVYTRQFTTYSSTTATVTGLENGKEYGFVVSAKVDGTWTNYNVPELLLYATPNP